MDKRKRTRLLYKNNKGELLMTGATPKVLQGLKEAEAAGEIIILATKPFVLGECFTREEEIPWKKAA